MAPRCEHGLKRGFEIVIVSYATAIVLKTFQEALSEVSFILHVSMSYMDVYFLLIGLLSFLDIIDQGLKAKHWPTEYAICLIFSMIICSAIIGYFEASFVLLILIVVYWLLRRFSREQEYYRRW